MFLRKELLNKAYPTARGKKTEEVGLGNSPFWRKKKVNKAAKNIFPVLSPLTVGNFAHLMFGFYWGMS